LQDYVRRDNQDWDWGKLIVMILCGLNAGVFLMWHAETVNKYWMRNNFLLSWQNLYARPWSLVTSMFSQNQLLHLAFNGLALWSFGLQMVAVLGASRFLTLYFVGGLLGNAVQLGYQRFVLKRDHPAHGASGAVMATIACAATLSPTSKILLLFIPVPAWLAVGGTFVYEVYSLATPRHDAIGHGAHLGGLTFGVLFGALVRSRRF